jgi:DNA-binding transcriptional ArsR family regulator
MFIHPADTAPRADPPGVCGHPDPSSPAMSRSEAEAVADVFRVLADPTRVLILEALREAGELCVLHLAEAVGMSQSAVSHNLRLLRQAGLVARRREGRLVYYRPDDEHVTGLIALCAGHMAHSGGAGDAS